MIVNISHLTSCDLWLINCIRDTLHVHQADRFTVLQYAVEK